MIPMMKVCVLLSLFLRQVEQNVCHAQSVKRALVGSDLMSSGTVTLASMSSCAWL